MPNLIFEKNIFYTKRARIIAILWTLLIFIACLLPANEIPHVDIPLIDKWVHFVLFGGLSFLCLCSAPRVKRSSLMLAFLLSSGYGWLMEILQAIFVSLGRSYENLDIVADCIGAMLGVGLFYIAAKIATRRYRKS